MYFWKQCIWDLVSFLHRYQRSSTAVGYFSSIYNVLFIGGKVQKYDTLGHNKFFIVHDNE
jgi:hypothetical protein